MLISMATKGWRRFAESSVTRRDGWLRLLDGYASVDGWCWADGRPAILEAIEWSPRVGGRWTCESCGALGPKILKLGHLAGKSPRWRICSCLQTEFWLRHPRRGCFIRVVDVRRERLAEMERADLALEGFPELTLVEFWRLYLGRPRWSDDQVLQAASRHPVTRIEFEHVEGLP